MQGGANKRDTDTDIFSSDGAKRRMPGMGVDGPDGDIISDTQTDTSNPYVPSISMHNTPFNNAQSSPQQQLAAASQQQLMMKPPGGGGVNNQQSSLNATMLQTKILQKLQQQHHQTQPPPPTGPSGMNFAPQGLNRGGQMQPPPPPQQQQQQASAAAAKEQHVLQQLKMAVQAGLISSQLLQQRLPPPLLFLLQQLLQCQMLLQQQVNKQQGLQQNRMSLTQAQRQQVEQHTIIIAKIRQQIVQYQQQIAQAQQVLKTQAPLADQQPGENNGSGSQTGVPLDLTNLGISGGGGAQQQQQPPQLSRLSQWKQPTPDKDLEVPPLSTEINKAPGSKTLQASHSNSNLDLVFLSPNTTWSTVAPTSSQNWPAVTSTIGSNNHVGGLGVQAGVDAKDVGVDTSGKESQQQAPSQASSSSSSSVFNMELGDIQVPEFIPGQPWIGFNKNVEDDPHITPGSVSNSLSVNVIRGEHLSHLSNAPNKSSPNPITSDSVGFRTQSSWAVKDFPKTTISSTSNSLTNKTWSTSLCTDGGQPPTTFSSEVWGVPFPKNSSLAAPTRPPPGLTNQSKSNWNSPGGGVNRQTSWSGRTESSAFTPGERIFRVVIKE